MKITRIRSMSMVTLVAVLFIIINSGCSNYEDITACVDGKVYGFWNGLWHGIIAPIDLIAMIWREDVTVYAPNNNGVWYAFGFVLGSGGWGFLSSKGAKQARRKREN